jgi:hypothetical protein
MTDTYSPALGARLLGGFQWSVTAMYIVGAVGMLYTTYIIHRYSGVSTVSYGRPAIGSMAIAFILGYLWAARYTKNASQERYEYGQRTDYLLLLWIGWPGVYAGLAHFFRAININLLNKPYIFPVIFGFGGVLFSLFIVYYLRVELAARFVG